MFLDEKKKLEDIIKEAKEKGYIIDVKEPFEKICSNRQDVAWYSGKLAIIKTEDYLITIEAVGDLRGYLSIDAEVDIRFRSPSDLLEQLSTIIEDDNDLHKLIDENLLVLQDNNWIEFFVRNLKTGTQWETEFATTVCDDNNVFDAICDYEGYLEFIEENKHLYE